MTAAPRRVVIPKNGLKVLKILLDDEILQIFHCYAPRDFKNLIEVASGGSALVYNVYWKNISKLAFKKFDKNFNQNTIINENLNYCRFQNY
ncbi:hypothetical protein RhiirA4_467745 [Rhizophagus irregularis]|uniref:Protein kinase domain-containing protein n=1 Tax=Rhizophagus irregularis TaxID=588596 RepID=A0A2I1GWE0_9GLOM|nr:hypothetical protein RhiirA4_467745 [Rhizophagus irregularis]